MEDKFHKLYTKNLESKDAETTAHPPWVKAGSHVRRKHKHKHTHKHKHKKKYVWTGATQAQAQA